LTIATSISVIGRWKCAAIQSPARRGNVASEPVCRADYTTQNVRDSVPWGQLLAEQSRTAPLRQNNSLMVMEAREVMHDVSIPNSNSLHYCINSRTGSKQNITAYKAKSMKKKTQTQKHRAIHELRSLLPTD